MSNAIAAADRLTSLIRKNGRDFLRMPASVREIDWHFSQIDPDVVKIIPEASARRHHALPFAKEDSVLLVAMADPRDFFISEDIHLRTGFDVQSYLALRTPKDDDRFFDTDRCISAKRTFSITCCVPPTLIRLDTRSGA